MPCVEVQKLPEGKFNKVFLLTMDDGKEVIAKLPNPNSGPQYFTTASEVATMDYVRNVLDIPAPMVYAWSPSTDEIGAEYIIMKKSQGVELGKLWDDIPGPDKLRIVQQLVVFEKALTSTRFPMYGSLYYADNLPNIHSNQMIEFEGKKNTVSVNFAVGPTTNRTFFDDGRNAVDVDRGPQLEAKKLRAAQSLYKLYDIHMIQDCPESAAALHFRNSLPGQITGLSGSLSSDGEPIVQGLLMRLQEKWQTYVGPSVSCPLSFTGEDKEKQKEDEKKWANGVVLMEEFLDQVGVYRGWDGWVNHDSYEHYKVRFEQCRQKFLAVLRQIIGAEMESRVNNQSDSFDPDATSYEGPSFGTGSMDRSDPAVLSTPIDGSIPDMISPAEVRRDAAARSDKISITYQTLYEILQRHEALIRKRWYKKGRQQRLKILLSAWPNMPARHRPDFEAFTGQKKGPKYRDAYMWPYINQEDLLNTKTLPLLLNARGRHHPSNFASVDFDATNMGRVSYEVKLILLDNHTMIINGLVENIENYGKLVAWSERPNASEWTTKKKQCIPGEGLLILEVQERLLTFLVQCCTELLHDIPESTLTSDSFLILPEPPFKPETDVSGFKSLGVMAAEAPYRVPAQLDLSLVESLLTAKGCVAEDHLWALREDPEFFSTTLHEAKDHHQETLKDLNGNNNPLLSRDRSQLLWADIIGSVVSKAYLDLEVFSELSSQAKKLVSLQRQYADDISPSRDLPEDYLDALLQLRYYLNHAAAESLSSLKCAVVASPPLRKYFARLPPPDAHSTNISVVLKSGFKMGKMEERLIWLLGTLSENGPFLYVAGMSLIMDELERLLESDTKARDLLSPYVTKVVGDISIISQCLHQLNIYYPWAREFDVEFHQREEKIDQDCMERTRSFAQFLDRLHDTSLLNRTAHLGDPSSGKFTYPIEKRRTKESVQALLSAEAHLDAFWAEIDRNLITKPGHSSDTAVGNLLSQPRISKRTGEWIEPTKASPVRTTNVKSKGDVTTYFSQNPTPEDSEIPAKSLDVAESRTKVKTRGIPQITIAITEAEDLTRPNTASREPTLFVDTRALKVFRTIFFNPTVTSTPGEVPWKDFLHAMVSVGFTAMKLYGSVWQFQPTRLNAQRSIQFHEPHPRGKLTFRVARLYGRMLNRAYGWVGEMFSLAQK
ncbi:hypothetical protein PEX1_018120 [Penicillium expansum]|uniref:Aminoglycoside phosphotransferase n=1 Tax=Penicillium expansum TaxID=27334 RepID=A0A0A2HZF4_PENEN|nr:hypothetical protein PEX2_082230 [Penicillium expansum]KGO36367.1 hypothetical protein PEXP_103270 [Penicillium expansum]KGO52576.1 hypothetical protein PEX2_082230 [Penicillium expansum]KGO61023.1 hypothetical protein PEX1_018120 [Penicillium expansum]